MRLKLKIYTWATALIVALAFLLAQVSCSGPTVRVGQSQEERDSLILATIQDQNYRIQGLEEKLRQKDTTEMIMWARIVELDSNQTRQSAAITGITKKAIRKYNTAATVGGFADGLFGQKLSRFGKKIEEVNK